MGMQEDIKSKIREKEYSYKKLRFRRRKNAVYIYATTAGLLAVPATWLLWAFGLASGKLAAVSFPLGILLLILFTWMALCYSIYIDLEEEAQQSSGA